MRLMTQKGCCGGMVLAVVIASAAFAETEKPQAQEPTVKDLVSKAVGLRGPEYLSARDAILTAAAQAAGRKALADLANDDKLDPRSRLLAQGSLLRLTDDRKVADFEKALSSVVAEHYRLKIGFETRVGPFGYLRGMTPEYLVARLRQIQGTLADYRRAAKVGKKKRSRTVLAAEEWSQWASALETLRNVDTALLGEALIWHTETTLTETLASRGGDQRPRLAPPARAPSPGVLAGFYLGGALAIHQKAAASDAAAILGEWAVREPNMAPLAFRDLCAVAVLSEVSEAGRTLAVKELIRAGIALSESGKVSGIDAKRYAVGCLTYVAVDSPRLDVPPAVCLEAVAGLAKIGGKEGRKALRNVATRAREGEVRKAAFEALGRQKSEGAGEKPAAGESPEPAEAPAPAEPEP